MTRVICAAGSAFAAYHYDAATGGLDLNGLYLIASRKMATAVEYSLEKTPYVIPCIYTREFPLGQVEIRHITGDILVRIESLAIPVYNEESR